MIMRGTLVLSGQARDVAFIGVNAVAPVFLVVADIAEREEVCIPALRLQQAGLATGILYAQPIRWQLLTGNVALHDAVVIAHVHLSVTHQLSSSVRMPCATSSSVEMRLASISLMPSIFPL